MGDVGVVVSSGLALGAAYALVGASVAVVGAATRTIHLAIGEILVVGVLTRLYLEAAGVPVALAVAGGVAAGALLSASLEPLVLARLRPGIAWLVGLAVAAAVIQTTASRLLASRSFRPRPLVETDVSVALGSIHLDAPVLTALALGVPGALVIAVLVRMSGWGRRVRLVGGSSEAASAAGVSPGMVRAGALAASGAAAVLAGLLVAPITFVGLGQGASFTIRAAAAAALLGRGGPAWALAGGAVVGMTEAAAQSRWPQFGGDVAIGMVLVAVLAARGGDRLRAWGRPW